MSNRFKRTTLCAAMALLPFMTCAVPVLAAPPDQAPGAGQLLRELPPAEAPPNASPKVNIQQAPPNTLDDKTTFRVDSIAITGNTLIDSETLHGLVADAEHRQITLHGAAEVVQRITDLYQQRGFPLTRAVIPAQTLSDGTLRVEIIEAVYGQVNLHNNSLVRDSVLNSTVASIESGQAVAQAPLDRAMLLLSDTPGVVVNATLAPGSSVGTTDIDVETTAADRIAGNVVVDNAGNRFTGRARVAANLALESPFRLGDQLTANVLSSGRDLNDAAIGYSLPVFDLATRVGIDYSALDYRLGGSLAPLDAFGTASVVDFWASHNFVRSVDFNSTGRVEFANKQLNDSIGTTGLHTDRHSDSVAATWSMDLRDAFFGGGSNNLSLTGTAGRLDFDSPGAAAADSASARIAGSYAKFNFSASRLQTLGTDTSLYVSLVGQYSNANLDSSEQLIAGGPSNGRGYEVGAVSGDEGDLFTVELRERLPIPIAGAWQGRVFYDADYIEVNQHRFAPGSNSAHLNSVGVGLDWFGPQQWTVRLDVAKAVGSTPTLLGSVSSPVRAWIELSKAF